jgi:hypothetical protein
MESPLEDVRLEALCEAVSTTADYLEVDLLLQSADDALHAVRARFYVFGRDEPGMGAIRRRAPVVLALGNRLAWRATRLSDGSLLDEARLVYLLTQLCDVPCVQSLRLGCEEQVSIPFNDHLVYHREVEGFRRDLREIGAMWLRGGIGLGDHRRTYETLRSDVGGETMLFARRGGGRLRDIKRALREHQTTLEALDQGACPPSEMIEDAALYTHGIEPLDTRTGLGVVATPLLGDYCEPLYLHIVERFSV